MCAIIFPDLQAYAMQAANPLIILFDYVSKIELFYNAADFTIIPSRMEGFGYNFLDV